MQMFSPKKFGPIGLLTRIKNTGSLKKGDTLQSSLILPATSKEKIDIYNLSQTKNIIIFVYPGDKEGLRYGELVGCTPEACSFRDSIEEFGNLNTVVFGLSMQSTERQIAFKEREKLNFNLLSDTKSDFINAFGIDRWETTESEENKEIFPSRTTVVIKKGGSIEEIISVENVDTHVEEVLEKIRTINMLLNVNYCKK